MKEGQHCADTNCTHTGEATPTQDGSVLEEVSGVVFENSNIPVQTVSHCYMVCIQSDARENPPTKTPSTALTGLRGAATRHILLSHWMYFWATPTYATDIAGQLAVPLFFVLSGFGVTVGYGHRILAKGSESRVLVGRFARLGPMYYVGLILAAVCMHLNKEHGWVGLMRSDSVMTNRIQCHGWVQPSDMQIPPVFGASRGVDAVCYLKTAASTNPPVVRLLSLVLNYIQDNRAYNVLRWGLSATATHMWIEDMSINDVGWTMSALVLFLFMFPTLARASARIKRRYVHGDTCTYTHTHGCCTFVYNRG